MDVMGNPIVQIVLVLILIGLLFWWFKYRPQSY